MANDVSSLQDAYLWASQLHADEYMDGPTPLPYLTHVVDVTSNLRLIGGVEDIDMLLAAILHDTVEAEATTIDAIRDRYGDRTAGLVAELTREMPPASAVEGLSADDQWSVRSEKLLQEIAGMSQDAMCVKLADRLANFRYALRLKSPNKLKRYIGQTKRILEIIPRETNPALWKAIKAEIRVAERLLK